MRRDIAVTQGDRERVSDRAFRVLGSMRELGLGPHSLKSIVRHTALSRSTVQRIIQSGVREGVIRQERHGHYALAAPRDCPGLLPVARMPVSAVTRRELDALQVRVGQTVCLHAAILIDVPAQTCVGYCRGPDGVPAEGSPGRVRPLDADAAGKVILAYLDMPHPNLATRNTIRRRGFAGSVGPARGWRMLAAPILRSGIPIGAVSLMGPDGKIEESFAACVIALKDVTAHINFRISCPRERGDR